jgi:hypothetical protein
MQRGCMQRNSRKEGPDVWLKFRSKLAAKKRPTLGEVWALLFLLQQMAKHLINHQTGVYELCRLKDFREIVAGPFRPNGETFHLKFLFQRLTVDLRLAQ